MRPAKAGQYNNDEASNDIMITLTIDQCLTTFREQCARQSKIELKNCGLCWELFERRMSAYIDTCLESIPAEYRQQVIEVARSEFHYYSQEEIAAQIEEDRKLGICEHGFDHDCCPLGCGEF